MKKDHYISGLIFSLLLSLLFLSACDKKQDMLNPDPVPALSYLEALNSTNEVFLTFTYYNPQNLTEPVQYENITITVTPLYPVDSFPKIVTICFDSSGVLCPDSIIRKGTMICHLNSPWDQHPSKADITFDGFYIDDRKINGLFSFTSTLSNDSLFLEYNIINGSVTNNSADSVTFNMNFKIQTQYDRTERTLEPFPWYSSGIHDFSGYDFSGKPFNVTISKQLFFDNICNNGEITTGEIRIVPDVSTDFSADFGNGECDRSLTIIFNGNSIPVSF